MLFLKQPLILHFLRHKSATTCQIDSYEVSKFESKLDLCKCVKCEIIESMASLQQQHKWGTIFWDTLYRYENSMIHSDPCFTHHCVFRFSISETDNCIRFIFQW